RVVGSIRGNAVLPAWTSPEPAGDLRGIGELRREARPPRGRGSPGALDVGVRQRAPALAALRSDLLPAARSVPGADGAGEEEVPFQEQTPFPGRYGDRSVRFGVCVGEVPAHQGGGEAASPARSRRLPADGGRDYRGEDR